MVVAVIGGGSDVNFRTDYWTFTQALPVPAAPSTVIDDFESGIAPAIPCPPGAPPLGFCTFNGAGSSVTLANPATPPAPPLPAVGTPNSVLQMDVDVTSFAGFIHGFSNPALDTWIPQDWSTNEGIALWMYGSNTGTQMFIDILDNRNPGSTVDDAERWSVAFADDFSGWQLLEFPFASFSRKEIGNGAPNDGLGLFQMHGYAIGTLGTGGPQTYFFDEVSVYGVAAPPALSVQFAINNTFVAEGTTGNVGRQAQPADGSRRPGPGQHRLRDRTPYAIAGEEYTPTSGTLTFVNGGASELTFPVETFDDTKFEGDEQIVIRLTNPVDVERGALFQASVLIDDNDPFDPKLLDDFEQGAFLWESDGLVSFGAEPVAIGDANERPGQDAVEQVLNVATPGDGPAFDALKEGVIADLQALLPASSQSNTRRIEQAIVRIERSLNPNYWVNGYFLDPYRGGTAFVWERYAVLSLSAVNGAEAAAAQDAIDTLVAVDAGLASLALQVAEYNNGQGLKILLARYNIVAAERFLANGQEARAIGFYNWAWLWATAAINGIDNVSLGTVGHDFALGQDWTGTESVDFWFYGTGSGEDDHLHAERQPRARSRPGRLEPGLERRVRRACRHASESGQLEL